MKETLKEITHALDHNYGRLYLKYNTLNNICTELGIIAEKVVNVDKGNSTSLAILLRDIDHKVELLADLMHYIVKELSEDLEKTRVIKDTYFDFHVRGINDNDSAEKGNTLESAKNQG